MSTLSSSRLTSQPDPFAADPPGDAHRLKRVPADRAVRARIRAAAIHAAAGLDRTRPLVRQQVEARARALLAELGGDEEHLGWTMVAVASAFWREHVEAIPHQRRLLLLPHCLRRAEDCPAKMGPLGLACEDCGACRLSDLKTLAERQGYRVMIAEGSPVVLNMILRGQADAILGAACLDSLEKALDKILLAGVPCMAVPLLGNGCRETATDEDWVREMIATPYRREAVATPSYVHLLRAATALFEPEELARLLPPSHPAAAGNGDGPSLADPVAATEAIARDFLLRGGKHLRPFFTLAAYEAASAEGTGRTGFLTRHREVDGLGSPSYGPVSSVLGVALAMEVFHKASLVHDDIADDDPQRYGRPALHRQYGTAVALNVGDYLIGLGYRLVAAEHEALGGDAVADILAHLAEAHTRLAQGQGAELIWRTAGDKRIEPLEALRIYALKTAPAFEAALYAGIRLAGDARAHREPLARFARHLGVAFQVVNDLDDWRGDNVNKGTEGTDVLAGRPTVLWALALDSLPAADAQRLIDLVEEPAADRQQTLESIRRLYGQAGVYNKAARLVAKHRARAHEVAETFPTPALQLLLHYLADAVLDA